MSHLSHFVFVLIWTYFDNCNPNTIKHDYSKSYEFICNSALTFFDVTLNENEKSNKKLFKMCKQNNKYAIHEKFQWI